MTHTPKTSERLETLRTVGAGLAIALTLRVLLFQPFTIPSSSMGPGLVTGDYILVSKWPYGWGRGSLPLNPPLPGGRVGGRAPKRGEVVVFRLPRDPKQAYIKRLIGLPGDRVQVRAGTVWVNDAPLNRRLVGVMADRDAPGRVVPGMVETAPGGRSYLTFGSEPGHDGFDTGVYVVPEGQYFFMGDNRDNSVDSRWPRASGGVDFVPAENLIGRAERVAVSWKAGASLFKPWTWLDLDWGRLWLPIR